jgi:signal peptide peptidase SppA
VNSLRIPPFARATDYVGPWAIEPTAAAALWNRAKSIDLAAHVQAYSPREPAGFEKIDAGGPTVAIVRLSGSLMKSESSFGGTSTVRVRSELRKAAADSSITAIVLAIDSPGGTVSGTDDLAADIRAAKSAKPVIAFCEDLCASAAYWAASQASAIYANSPTAIVGSIGTLLTLYDQSEAAEKEGLEALVFATGPMKGAGFPGSEVTPKQRAYFQGIVDDAQVHFDQAVTTGRRLSPGQLAKVKSGGVFGATEALALGLIDGIKSFSEVLAGLGRGTITKERTVMAGETITATADVGATGEELVATLGADHELLPRAMREGWSNERARREENLYLKAQLPKGIVAMNPHSLPTKPNGRGQATNSDLFAAALLVRIGMESHAEKSLGAEVMERSRGLHRMSFVEMAAHSLRMAGREVPYGKAEVVMAALSGGDMSTALGTTINLSMLAAYQMSRSTWQSWAARRIAEDFKTQTSLRPSFFGDLQEVPPGGDVVHGHTGEATLPWRVKQFAKQFGVDRIDLVNDSLGVFSELPTALARAALRSQSDLIYATLMLNGGDHYHTDNGNILSGGTSVLSPTSFGNAAKTLREQTDAEGNCIDIFPTVLVVPPALEATARSIVQSVELNRTGDLSPTANPYANMVTVEVEPRLSNDEFENASDVSWYLFGSPMDVPFISGTLGSGNPILQTFSWESNPDKLAASWRVILDHGCAFGDPKASVFSVGS